MKNNLKMSGRSLLTLRDISDEEFLGLMELTATLKAKKERGEAGDLLQGKHLALVFEKMCIFYIILMYYILIIAPLGAYCVEHPNFG